MNLLIIPEREQDIPQVHQLHVAAFGREEEANLVDELRRGPSFVPGLSLVALLEHTVMSHLLLSSVSIVTGDGLRHPSLALAPIAVRPEVQRKGIGSRLIAHGLETARQMGFLSVIVLGHEHYYPRFGFRPALEWGITAPFRVPSSAFMALELVPGSLQTSPGVVEYPPAFFFS